MFNFKNPFRDRYLVIGGVQQKANFLQVLSYISNQIPFQSFDTDIEAETYIKFQYNKLSQHEAVIYLLSTNKMNVAQAAKCVYSNLNHIYFTDSYEQENFEMRLTHFLAESHLLTEELSSELGSIFGLEWNHLFKLQHVNIYENLKC